MTRLPYRIALLSGLTVLVGAASVCAQTKSAGKSAKADDTVVVTAAKKPDEVLVVAPPPMDPKVVSTFPKDGAKAPGGVLVLKVVFDQAMTAEAWSFGQMDGGAFPNCLKKPRLLPDLRSFALLCTVGPNTSYSIQINASPDFVSARGRSAKPFLLHFSTTDATVYDMHAALLQAGLTDADEPIMTWNGAPGGVSRQPPPPRAAAVADPAPAGRASASPAAP